MTSLLDIRSAERDNLLANATYLLQRDSRVVATWLFGSLGEGTADSLSDIDLWVVVADEHIGAVAEGRREYVARLGEPLLIQEAPQNAPAEGAYLLVLYGGEIGPHQIDWYWQAQKHARVPPGSKLLFDRAGIPPAQEPTPMSQEERAQAIANNTAFFWAMSNITAKKIARRQPWVTLRMLGMLQSTLDEVRWLVGASDAPPGFKDTHSDLPPVEPGAQMATLRGIAGKMDESTPPIEAMGVEVPAEAIRQVYQFFDLAENIIRHE